ncbi:centromere-associated protein E-like [Leptopilina boulardi]|uniref:centromere-associated protein E-like n=1 Tax=Leptopilina boulardi TaxID=63433 RepID=UPI0021F58A94|nr:centromere-associated protein E-like [Leptopilina boulardi]XP_051156039.1 centromere-associated protein E-like [Leptopilina boulardi]
MKDMDDKSFTEKISRGSQAVSGCFKDCRSCSLASSTILDLVKEIEITFHEYKLQSFAAKERELSKFGLWDKSQWAVMSKLAEAINQDVRIILNLVQDNARISESVKRDHDNTMKRLQVNLKSKISELDTLKLKNVNLEEKIQNVVSEMEKVGNNQLETEQKNIDLITELQETRGQMSSLVECNQIIQKQLIEVIITKSSLEKTIDTLNNQLEINKEKSNFEIQNLHDVISNLQLENINIKREFECRIAKLEEKVSRKSLTNRNNQNCRCTGSVEKLTKTNSNSYSRMKSVVKSEDNPEVDMTQQFNSNQQKIKELTRQNERLSKTIERLREYRLCEIEKK